MSNLSKQITIDFVSGLPLTPTKKDSIGVIVYQLTKLAHFLPVCKNYSLQKLTKLYISEIIPVLHLDFGGSYKIRWELTWILVILEDMLRGCTIEFRGSWEEHLLLSENNSFQSSIQMTPYEAFYGHKC
ncbi:DNA/RNA polymerases superfamily protein [Gossypium australe]|uniref:DNA/RNA polymerases superfamily protein n=1 Tax=Gossypium australe TaxID=47621 RepID=A0A5B6X1F8_9ROSI|nr:DNA/RNA polymerases superfamily protein [Gossypium australe]